MSYGKWETDVITMIVERLEDASQEGNCLKRKVGAAILDRTGKVLASAANGTPQGIRRCDAGGCVRCAHSGGFPHGVGYDLCICMHAEQAVLISAIQQHIHVDGLILATNYQPCFMCAKLIVASGFDGVLYSEPWHVPEEQTQLPGLRAEYATLWGRLPSGCKSLAALFD
jgi:dCMP deaminase